jgi:hypothetical protein
MRSVHLGRGVVRLHMKEVLMAHIQQQSRLIRAGTRNLSDITSVFMEPFPVTSVTFMEVRHSICYFSLDSYSVSHFSPGLSAPLVSSYHSCLCLSNAARTGQAEARASLLQFCSLAPSTWPLFDPLNTPYPLHQPYWPSPV